MVGNLITSREKLGEGGYGTVYRVEDEHGHSYASKMIQDSTDGIPCLMEAAIMQSFHHPNINRALKVYAKPRCLYIIQDLADGDAINYIRKNGPISDEQLRLWTFQLLQAVTFLHSQQLIHCDIKAHNVLVFGSDIRLNDFTLIRRTDWGGSSVVGTSTHRALNIWLGRRWGMEIDIWALGCTLYQLATGKLLIPVQSGEDYATEKNQYLNCLLDWGEYMNCPVNISRKPGDYIPPDFNEIDFNLQNRGSDFRDLVYSMLRFNHCPSSSHLLYTNKYTAGLTMSRLIVSEVKQGTPTSKTIDKWLSYLPGATGSYEDKIRDHTILLMSRLMGLTLGIEPRDLVLGCYWIASKLIIGYSPKNITLPQHQIRAIEREICLKLNFRLTQIIK